MFEIEKGETRGAGEVREEKKHLKIAYPTTAYNLEGQTIIRNLINLQRE